MPHSIRRLRERGHLVKDMYKLNTPSVPTNGGMILVFTSFTAISVVPLLVRLLSFIFNIDFEFSDLSETHLAMLLVISVYALYGLVDDLVEMGRILKTVLPITFTYPLISIIAPTTFPFFNGDIDLSIIIFANVSRSDLFRIIIIPIYVMVVSNLVNMHSGYNGLQSGLSTILVAAICLKSYIDGSLSNIFPIASILGSMCAFLWFNKFPSKIFEGNIGSLFFGSAIGVAIVIQEYWWFGFFILIPHSFNFLLWLLWIYLMNKHPDNYLTDKGSHQKFGMIRKDNTLMVPNGLTLKWIPNYYFKLEENTSVWIMYLFTSVFCLTGLFLFK